jgi:hypothetical protein
LIGLGRVDRQETRRRKRMRASFAATVAAVCLASAASADLTPTPGPYTATIEFTDKQGTNEYLVEFLGVDDKTWSYEISEVSGKSLSHWNIGIENCLDHIISYSPEEGYEAGTDGSTGFVGVKWDLAESFTSGIFSFTLDDYYAISTVEILAKAGPNSGTAYIAGPDCDCLVIPEPMSLGLGALGLVMLSLRRR